MSSTCLVYDLEGKEIVFGELLEDRENSVVVVRRNAIGGKEGNTVVVMKAVISRIEFSAD